MAPDDVADFTASPQTADDRTQQAHRLPVDETEAWVDGGIAGLTGAAVVALFFLIIDLAQGVPLRTPGMLGTALFLGQSLAPGTAPSLAPALGYTVVHAVIFAALGVGTAFALIGYRRPLGPLSGLGLAVGLFAAMEALFAAGLALAAPQLIAAFGAGMIATANLLAAAAMSAMLLRRHHPAGPVFRKRVVAGVATVFVLVVAFLVVYCSSAYVALEQSRAG
jgi:hypothetical protein